MHVEEEEDARHNSPDMSKYKFVKRAPLRPHAKKNDIYVVTNRPRAAFSKRALELLFTENLTEVFIHALGGAIDAAVGVALELQSTQAPWLGLETTTSTEVMIDDFVPLQEHAATLLPLSQRRLNSAIHIRVYKLNKDEMVDQARLHVIRFAQSSKPLAAVLAHKQQQASKQRSKKGESGGGAKDSTSSRSTTPSTSTASSAATTAVKRPREESRTSSGAAEARAGADSTNPPSWGSTAHGLQKLARKQQR